MVLPGIQALFGFQLIAVFSPGFQDGLGHAGQLLHLVSIGLVAISIALVMTPAAYHRQCLPDGVSEDFIALASKLLLLSMVPLLVATSIELALIASVILGRSVPAAILGAAIGATIGGLWFVLPRVHQHATCGTERSSGGPHLGVDPSPQR